MFNKLIRHYTHKYFSRYPQFQLSELAGRQNKSSITNNSNSFLKGGSRDRDYDKGKGTATHLTAIIVPTKEKTIVPDEVARSQECKPKGKGKTGRKPQGNRTDKDPCSYCNKNGHEARECRKRIYDEKQKTKETHTNNAQQFTWMKQR
jgi:hypothetical protein